MEHANMLSHMSDDELIRYVWSLPRDDLADELFRRFEELVGLLEELDENLKRLAAKYDIDEDDLWQCDDVSITPPRTCMQSIG